MRLSIFNRAGSLYHIDTICGDTSKCKVIRDISKKQMIFNTSQQELYRNWSAWRTSNQNIQDVLSQLTPGEREFIMTGITPDEWRTIHT